MNILFIAKQRSDSSYSSVGLWNSVEFLKEELLKLENWVVNAVKVVDNNDIDREVTNYKPDVVIIEALWVVPEKFDILKKLHPNVKWIIRLHSELAFLATEGIALDWINCYINKGIYVATNSKRGYEELSLLFPVLYLPTIYPLDTPLGSPFRTTVGDVVNIGSFGAIRPLKNQLAQAVAAIGYADDVDKTLYFHINGGRVERGGEEVLKNIRGLFKHSRHTLVEHPWHTHKEFSQELRFMDACMCVSFTESFCIVAADIVVSGVPLVCSNVVPWVGKASIANTVIESKCKLKKLLGSPMYRNRSVKKNYKQLMKYSYCGIQQWVNQLEEI